jgi:hypothetical protein
MAMLSSNWVAISDLSPRGCMFIDDNLAQCMLKLQKQGYKVRPRTKDGELRFEIDDRILADPEELEHLAECVYSLEDLEELHMRRRAEEQASG